MNTGDEQRSWLGLLANKNMERYLDPNVPGIAWQSNLKEIAAAKGKFIGIQLS
jgi:hypothetical protein